MADVIFILILKKHLMAFNKKEILSFFDTIQVKYTHSHISASNLYHIIMFSHKC